MWHLCWKTLHNGPSNWVRNLEKSLKQRYKLTRLLTCTDCKFVHQEAPLASVANWVRKWHNLHCFQSWPPGCITALPHCLELPYWHYQLVLSWYPHQPESHQSQKGVWRTDGHPDPKIELLVYLSPIKIFVFHCHCKVEQKYGNYSCTGVHSCWWRGKAQFVIDFQLPKMTVELSHFSPPCHEVVA